MPGAKNRSGGDRSTKVDRSEPDGLPVMPTTISPGAAAKWSELLEQLPSEALRRIDCHQLGLLAELLYGADVLSAKLADDPADEKSRRLFLGTCDRVQRLSSMFGLSPVDRQRMKIEPKQNDDELQDWIKRGGLN